MTITVLSPVGINRVEARAVAPRIPSLNGARLGLVDNNKPNAARLLEGVVRLLGAQQPLGGTVSRRKPNASVGVDRVDELAQEVQAAVVAVGD